MTAPREWPAVVVYSLVAGDEKAQEHQGAAVHAAERAGHALQFSMLRHARERLTEALSELDALEARLAELEEQQ